MEVNIIGISNGNDLANKILETAYGKPNFTFTPNPNSNEDTPSPGNGIPVDATSFVTHYSQLANENGVLYIYDGRPQYANNKWPSGYSGKFELNVHGEAESDKDLFLHLKIQVGSNEGQNVTISIPNVTPEHLKINQLSVRTQEESNITITIIDDAIEKVSKARSLMGAYQNKFEHAYNNVMNTAEKLTNAESQLRDADMAKEMTSLQKDQILLQSSQSMMAQINQMNQGILEILG